MVNLRQFCSKRLENLKEAIVAEVLSSGADLDCSANLQLTNSNVGSMLVSRTSDGSIDEETSNCDDQACQEPPPTIETDNEIDGGDADKVADQRGNDYESTEAEISAGNNEDLRTKPQPAKETTKISSKVLKVIEADHERIESYVKNAFEEPQNGTKYISTTGLCSMI